MTIQDEKKILPPTNPVTLKINGAVLGWYFDYFLKKFLPAYSVRITSGYREPGHNEAAGGVPNSAHLHNLAYDFVLQDGSGHDIPEAQAKKVYNEFVVPNWQGWTEFEASQPGKEGYHIHVNMSRNVSTYTALVAISGIGLVSWVAFQKVLKGSAS